MKTSQKSNTSVATQANAFKEKLELIKKKSIFIEEVMKSLEVQRDRSNFILDSFKRALLSFPTSVKASGPEELREWPSLSSLKEADQPMTQEEMEELWQSIEQLIDRKDIDDYAIIDFEKGCFVWNGISLSFLDAVIEIKPVSIDPLKSSCESFVLHSNNHLKGFVYLWDSDETVQGLLKAVDERGKNWFFELEHFVMMNLTLTHPDNSIPKGDGAPSGISSEEDNPKDGEASVSKEWVETINPGMFLLLNKPWQALFVTRF